MSYLLRHIKGHAVGTGIQVHFMQILMHINIRQDSSRKRIVFQIVNHAVHLIKQALFIQMLYTKLIAVSLADTAVFIRPFVPDMAV